MAGKRRARPEERELEGFKFLEPISELLATLRQEADQNPNRQLHFDHYVALLIFYFFNPTLTSLRGLQASTEFAKVQRKLKLAGGASLGSLSAAQHVFDHEALKPLLEDLLERLPADKGSARLHELKEIVTVADGTLLRALPRVVWALWLNEKKRAAKAHVQFEVLKGAPSAVDVTAGNADEKAVFAKRLESGRLYVLDCGYAKFGLFQAVIDAGSHFVCRLPNNWVYTVEEERPLSEADREARVLRDLVVKLGSGAGASKDLEPRPMRVIEIERVDEPSKRMRRERPVRETIVLVTDRLDLPADLIAILYSARWKIEIFFRWLKCTLGCKNLLAESENGAALQVYAALISCLLISLWLGRKPDRRTFEAICFYLQGLADVEDVIRRAKRCKPHEP
jgi:hypothetical protein